MDECAGYRRCCHRPKTDGVGRVHRCFLNPDHPEDYHVCICFFQWGLLPKEDEVE